MSTSCHGSPQALVERVNEMTKTAKASWFGLLSYLAFVGVTLMGVRDEDFFLVEKETQLPLIGVSIPTLLFFYVAPILGMSLFAYLHLHLLKLWEALSDALQHPALSMLSEHVAPWLITDFALSLRPGALRKRPAIWLVQVVAILLAYLAAPVVLFFFWWRSMPKHDTLLTMIFCGVPLFLTLYLALISWRRLYWLLRKQWGMETGWRWDGISAFSMIVLFLAAISWFRTEEPAGTYFDPIARKFWEKWDAKQLVQWDIALQNTSSSTYHPISNAFWNKSPFTLRSADLAGVNFAYLPQTWQSFEEIKKIEKNKFCKIQNVSALLCISMHQKTEEAETRRQEFCEEQFGRQNNPEFCSSHFEKLQNQFADQWPALWKQELEKLTPRAMKASDLRTANLSGANLQRVELDNSDLRGSNLRSANLSGASLVRAKLEDAKLWNTKLRETDLTGASMQNIQSVSGHYFSAQMEGADLTGAVIVDSDFSRASLALAKLNGAKFVRNTFFGVNFAGISTDRATSFLESRLTGSSLFLVDEYTVDSMRAHWDAIFADGSVRVPKSERPAHWADEDLPWQEFETRWRAWQQEIGFDPDALD
ncbi:pentapeptide repeat-containing protein [Thalassococcus lentus]|uniref:Pentapeptide repeat-containing protein n=1 Tax=Thalassococcus lentus TaxID=1210524 RepID=A0ABT4XX65_9RHOB|nr:pentapeptide repeat-containing protein [Thalassococcus lentus]MDA7426561.1 pentapeptide repeat-containing protein [Thalassococcus lentus]